MDSKNFVAVCFSDLAGQIRGHGVPRTTVRQSYASGLPWPADLANLTVFGEAVETPWPDDGGLWLRPDANAEVTINFGDDAPTQTFVLGTLQTHDRQNWGGCTRSFLQATLDILKSEFGLDVSCIYEHQFSLAGNGRVGMPAMSLSALRCERHFVNTLATVLDNAGITLVRFGAGVGERQFTATTQAKFGVAAADSAVIFRQLVHATADQLGQPCSFAPRSPSSSNHNGVTLGIDLFDDGDQVTYDSTAPDGISAILGSFIAGIQRHLPSLSALTRPSIVPTGEGETAADFKHHSGRNAPRHNAPIIVNPALNRAVAREYSFAFTAADATACPYLQFGAILCAGLLGLREALPAPNGSLHNGGAPSTLSDALSALSKDQVFSNVFPAGLLAAYTNVKQAELATVSRMSPAELGEWSQEIY